jgi:hypothetical protein
MTDSVQHANFGLWIVGGVGVVVAAIGAGFLALCIWFMYGVTIVQHRFDVFIIGIETAFFVAAILSFLVAYKLMTSYRGDRAPLTEARRKANHLTSMRALTEFGLLMLAFAVFDAYVGFSIGRLEHVVSSILLGGVAFCCFKLARVLYHGSRTTK